MSDTEIGGSATDLPPQNKFYANPEGLTSWAASFDRVIIREAANDAILLKIVSHDVTVFEHLLTRDQAHHLAALLTGEAA